MQSNPIATTVRRLEHHGLWKCFLQGSLLVIGIHCLVPNISIMTIPHKKLLNCKPRKLWAQIGTLKGIPSGDHASRLEKLPGVLSWNVSWSHTALLAPFAAAQEWHILQQHSIVRNATNFACGVGGADANNFIPNRPLTCGSPVWMVSDLLSKGTDLCINPHQYQTAWLPVPVVTAVYAGLKY